MNSRYFTIILLCTTFILSGCDHTHSKLKLAESLMETHSDSSLTILKSIRESQKMSEGNRSLYDLLMVQALDNNEMDITNSPSLSDAVNYYMNKKDSLHIAHTYLYMARVCYEKKDIEHAFKYYLKAKDWIKTCNDDKYKLMINSDLGWLYYLQNLDNQGIKTNKEALFYADKIKNNVYRSMVLNAIAIGYSSINQNDSSLLYYFRAEVVSKRYNQKQLLPIYSGMSRVYCSKHQFSLAMKYCDAAIAQSSPEKKISRYYIKGGIFNSLQQYDSAVFYLKKGLDFDDVYNKYSTYVNLGTAYSHLEQNAKAVYCLKKASEYRDSMDVHTRTTAIVQMQAAYKYDKTNEVNQQLKKDKVDLKHFISIIICITLLIMVSIFHYVKKKKQEHEIERLKNKNEITELKDHEYKLRDSFYKELILNVTPSLRHIRDTNKNILTEENWLVIIKNTDTIFNNFTKRLQNDYPILSESDIRFLCLEKMNMEQTEIAKILNIALSSVKKRKSRISTDKLGLKDAMQLKEFLSKY